MNDADNTQSLSLMHEAGMRLGQTLDIKQVYGTLRDLLTQAMDCDELIVSSFDPVHKLIHCEYYHSWTQDVDVDSLPPLPLSEDGSGAQSRVIVTGKSMIIPNYHIFMRSGKVTPPSLKNTRKKIQENDDLEEVENRSAIVVPMKLDNKVVGVVQIFSYRYNAYSEHDYRLAEAVTAQMAAARNNAILYRSVHAELEQRRLLQEKLEEERRFLEQRVEERTGELVQALRVRDEFLSNMSHELRTPLASIQGLSELLQYNTGTLSPEKQKRYLDLIYQNSEHLIQMVNDLLDMAKIATGEMKLHKEWTALESICQPCYHYAEGRAIEKNINVQYVNHSGIPRLYCDPHRTKQLLNNLLNNAVKFTPEGNSIGFEIALSDDSENLEFTVWDQGVGIAEENLARVLEPFSHMQTPDIRTLQQGMGIGLVMTKRLAELQGGSFEIKSQPNHGTLVIVSLPIHVEIQENGHGYTTLLTPDQTGILRQLKDAMKNKVVLIADGDSSCVEMAEHYFEFLNVKPRIVNSGAALKAVLNSDLINLLILDLALPGMDALRTIQDIRAMRQYERLPIIATSAIRQTVDPALIQSLNVNDFLKKPFTFSTLSSKIRKYVE